MIVRRKGVGFVAASTAGTVAASSGPLAPIVLGATGVLIGLRLLFGRKGPKQRVEATEIVEEVEPYLQQNLDAYMAGPRTPEDQQAAVAYFDDAWAQMAAALSNPELGKPGKVGILDRQRGGKHDWFRRYRDPIANDVPRSATTAQVIGGDTLSDYALPAAALLILIGVLS